MIDKNLLIKIDRNLLILLMNNFDEQICEKTK